MAPGRGRIARRAAIIAVALATIAVLCAWRLAQSTAGPQDGDLVLASAGGAGTAGSNAFSISGSVTGLFPGAQTTLVLTVTNSMSFAIQVNQVTVAAGNAASGCAAANLTVGSFTGAQQVPAHGTATLSLPVAMSHGAGNGCQGAHFPLQYTATATRAGAKAQTSASGQCAEAADDRCA